MEIVAVLIALALGLVGLLGTLVPALPGLPIIYLGILLHGFLTGFSFLSVPTYIILGVATVLSIGVDYLATAIGAKKLGASKAGIWGAIIGGVIGLFVGNIFGLILGPFFGAIIGEIISGKDAQKAVTAGSGAMVGFLAGGLVKFLIGVIMIVVFVSALFIN